MTGSAKLTNNLEGRMMGSQGLNPSYTLSGHATEVTEQARHIDRARGQKDGHQHLVHRGLRGPPVESLAKHGRDSDQESQNLFFGGFISHLRNPARFSGDEDRQRIGSARFCEERKQRAMGVRRRRPDAARSQHQRRADRGNGPAVPLAARSAPGRL
jgi:hypothetical protein